MGTVIIVSVAFLTGAAAGFLISCRTITHLRRRVRALRSGEKSKRQRKIETMKKIVWVCLVNGFIWVWCSYILAYLDKPQIAEGLSQVAVTEIIGVVLAYALKSAVENLSKNNHWPDKSVCQSDASADNASDGSTGVG